MSPNARTKFKIKSMELMVFSRHQRVAVITDVAYKLLQWLVLHCMKASKIGGKIKEESKKLFLFISSFLPSLHHPLHLYIIVVLYTYTMCELQLNIPYVN